MAAGPIHFTGTNDGLFDRHLLFDNVMDVKSAGPREQFEAFAKSVRDILSQRWVRTDQTYDEQNPKRVYLSLHGIFDWPIGGQQRHQSAD